MLEEGDRIAGDRAAAEFVVERLDVDDEAFGVAPQRVVAERYVESGVHHFHAAVVALARLVGDEFEIAAHGTHGRLVGDAAMAGHDDLDVHAFNALQHVDPVRDRAGP